MIEIALELERVARSDEYFIQRKLYPNVDFFSGGCCWRLQMLPRRLEVAKLHATLLRHVPDQSTLWMHDTWVCWQLHALLTAGQVGAPVSFPGTQGPGIVSFKP